MCNMFGGASQAEKSTLGQTRDLATTLLSNFRQRYAQQSDVLKQLAGQIMKIQTGQTGPGFSGAENAARESMIINQGAAAARNAIQAERSRAAGAGPVYGGGSTGLERTAAINRQIAGGIEALAGANTSNQLLRNTAENYAQGRVNAAQAASGFQALAGEYNPAQYGQMAGTELGQQFNQAHEINQEEIARSQAILGTVTGIGKMAAGFATGGLANLGAGESLGEGFGDFFKGGLDSLAGH